MRGMPSRGAATVPVMPHQRLHSELRRRDCTALAELLWFRFRPFEPLPDGLRGALQFWRETA